MINEIDITNTLKDNLDDLTKAVDSIIIRRQKEIDGPRIQKKPIRFRQFIAGKEYIWGYVPDPNFPERTLFVPPFNENSPSDRLAISHPGIGDIYENDIVYGDTWNFGACKVKIGGIANDFAQSVFLELIEGLSMHNVLTVKELDKQAIKVINGPSCKRIHKIGNMYQNRELLGWGLRAVTNKSVPFNEENRALYEHYLYEDNDIKFDFMDKDEIDAARKWYEDSLIFREGKPDNFSVAVGVMKKERALKNIDPTSSCIFKGNGLIEMVYKDDIVTWENMKGEKFSGRFIKTGSDCAYVILPNGDEVAVSGFATSNGVYIDLNNGTIGKIKKGE